MKYKGISSRERELLEELKRRNILVFNPLNAANILSEDRENTHRILSRMESKDIIHRIERGKYISSKAMNEEHIYKIASHIVEPSYVSLWSGLHYYGYTTQVPRTIHIMVTEPKKIIQLQSMKIKFVKTGHFFGYISENDLVIAEPEKLFIDCLLYPDHAGGLSHIRESLDEAELDGERIVDYALKTNNRSLNSRLGYLLQKTDKNFPMERLKENISSSPVQLEPSKSGKKKNNEWNVMVC